MKRFPIIGFFGPNYSPNAWTVSHADRLTVAIDADGSTMARSKSVASSYLIHNAGVKNFKHVRDDQGIPVPPNAGFSISIHIEELRGARAGVHLLEYDESGARSGETRLGTATSVHYVPRSHVKFIVLAVRIIGEGDVILRDLSLSLLPHTENATAGLHKLSTLAPGEPSPKDAVLTLKRDIRALEATSRRLGRHVNSLLPTLESRAQNSQYSGTERDSRRASQSFSLDLLLEMAKSLPTSNGSHYFAKRFKQRVAIITDVYMLNFYKDAFEQVIYVDPERVDEVIAEGFDLLLYVTCWKGVHDEEWRGIRFRATPSHALDRLIEHSRRNGIPTAFQSIEDPSNFEYFLPIAEKFDYVFTSDSDCIERYRRELRHGRVYYGEYGANPLLNNPIGNRRFNLNRAFFAGSYPRRYAERTADMQVVFDSILDAGPYLAIADRNAGADGLEFPARFEAYCLPPIPHELLQRVHKLFRYSLNFNSIKSSPTMCAMRVYELQAQGLGLISNYARSVLNKFPEIRIVAHPEDLGGYFASAPDHEEHKNNEQLIRNVMTEATSFDIAGRMLDCMNLDTQGVTDIPTVTIFGRTDSQHYRESFERQAYPRLVSARIDATPAELDRSVSDSRYFAIFHEDVEYGPHYVTDRVNAFKFTDSDFVTQEARPLPDGQMMGLVHEYTSATPSAPLTLYASDRIPPSNAVHGNVVSSRGGYAIAPYQACEKVTQRQASPELLAAEPVLSVIVPVHDNGRFLLSKCMPSIMRNRNWRNYEVILVDDGSRDPETKGACEGLTREYPNVRLFSYDDGGSGSASRPRNKGVELARAALVTFLDPDNEISDGGYDKLISLFEQGTHTYADLGFVSGYQVKVLERSTITGKHSKDELTFVEDARTQFFAAGRFPVVSTQAAVISKRVLEQAKLSFIEGAAGQDTLFGWELLLAGSPCAFTDAAHLIYYAERSDSVTNAVGVRYFEKNLVMERAQVDALRRYELFEEYVEHHLKNFVEGWYMKKFELVAPQHRDRSMALIRDIVALYETNLDAVLAGALGTGPREGSN